MTAAPGSRTGRSGSAKSLAAVALNFPVVFASLVLITTQTNGNDEVALLNLWAWWGVSNGLLGQFGLITGVLDRQGTKDAPIWFHAGLLAVGAGAIAALLESRLFPNHGAWWAAAALLSALAYLAGRARSMLTLRCEGENALAVTAGENVLRLAALIVAFALLDHVGSAHVIAVVAPLAVSVLALDLLSSRPHPKGNLDINGQQSVPFGLLAGVPSLLAYLVVPALSILGTTDDLDAFAIASSLGRGPLLIATFAAPALLQTLYSTRMAAALRRVRLGAAVLLVVQIAAGALLSLALWPTLIVQVGITAGVALLAYVVILQASNSVGSRPWLAIAGAAATFGGVITIAHRVDQVHPFVAWSAACAAAVVFLALPEETST